MGNVKYLKIYSDEKGCSHFESKFVDMALSDYAPPAPALNTSKQEPASSCVFLELPAGWYGQWHPTPVLQWLILMSGELEFEAGDGERAIRRVGDVIQLADTVGKGHQTRVLGTVDVRIAAIHIQ